MKLTSLWNDGDLFHAATRYPRRADAPRVDRLAGILRNGLIAPGCCEDGSVCSDLHLTVTGTEIPYDSLVFLHRFGPNSWLYLMGEPDRFMVFVDPEFPVMTPQEMPGRWLMLSQDEVYVRERVPPEHLIGVAVHGSQADAVMSELRADFEHLGIPLYDIGGEILWRPEG